MRVLFILLLLLLNQPGFAQKSEPLRFDRIGGLSQNTVYSILKDRQGFMWIATANGLNRYDGVEMKAYKPTYDAPPGQMKGRIIRSGLYEDANDHLWFATDRGINAYEKRRGRFKHHQVEKKDDKGAITQVDLFANPLIAYSDSIWFATATGGLFVMDLRSGKFSNYPVTIKDDQGNALVLMYNGVFDGKDKLWFASPKGLLSFDMARKSWTLAVSGRSYFSIALYRDTIILGSGRQLEWFDTRTTRSGSFPVVDTPINRKLGMMRRIITDDKQNVWAGDQDGNIFRKAPDQDFFRWNGNINGNSGTNYPVYCLYADTIGNLWAGADVLGLLKAALSPPAIRKYPNLDPADPSIKPLFVYTIYEDNDNRIWLGSFQNGAFVVEKETGRSEPLRLPFLDPRLPYGKSVPKIAEDKYGNLWLSYSGILYVREKGSTNLTPVNMPEPTNALQSPQMNNLVEYKDGWLVATNIGLYCVSRKDGSYHAEHLEEFTQSRVIDLWVGDDGRTWLVPESDGVLIYDSPKSRTGEKRIFQGLNVKSIEFDAERNLLWLSTSDGLIAYHVADGQYRFFTEANGLLSSFVFGVVRSGDALWASTSRGLSTGRMVFGKSAVFPEINFVNYTVSEGLPLSDFNTGAFYKGRSGTLYFGSTSGVVWFDPADIKPRVVKPNLQLTDFRVNEQPADSLIAPEYIQSIVLPYSRNTLFFQFREIDFNNANRTRYRYQLEGWDKDWVYSNTLNEVRYNNLPHGHYVFKVVSKGSAGVWSDARKVTVEILAPFWRTWWFYMLLAMSLVIAIVMITRFFAQQKLRVKVATLEKQKELEKERSRISREMHDEIGSGLTQIVLMSESVKNNAGAETGKILQDITGTSRQLVTNMSEIIWSLGVENRTLDQLCSYIREQLHRQLEYSGIDYEIHMPEQAASYELSNEQRRNILLITKEIVNNAIKHSRASHLLVRAAEKDGVLSFEISDNGTGFDPGSVSRGNGLKNISSRIEELGGQVDIISSGGAGTVYKYSIDLKRSI